MSRLEQFLVVLVLVCMVAPMAMAEPEPAGQISYREIRNPRVLRQIWNDALGTNGTKNGTTVAAAESTGFDRVTELTLTSVAVAIPHTGWGTTITNTSGGTKIYDMPKGRILVRACGVEDLTTATNRYMFATNICSYALGTTVGSGAALTSTEVDLCPTNVPIQMTNTLDNSLAASAEFDGRSTAKDVYLNQLIDINIVGGFLFPTTNYISGKVHILWRQGFDLSE